MEQTIVRKLREIEKMNMFASSLQWNPAAAHGDFLPQTVTMMYGLFIFVRKKTICVWKKRGKSLNCPWMTFWISMDGTCRKHCGFSENRILRCLNGFLHPLYIWKHLLQKRSEQ